MNPTYSVAPVAVKQLDFEATRIRARAMTSREALVFTIEDCVEAAAAADAIEKDGGLGYMSKSGGYYRDEASVYRTELRRRDDIARELAARESRRTRHQNYDRAVALDSLEIASA